MREKKRLGEILIEQNRLLPEQLQSALDRQKETGQRLGQVLIDMGLLSYEELYSTLSDQTGIPHIWLRKGLVDPSVVHVVPRDKAEAYCCIPMFKVRNMLTLAMAQCDDIYAIDDVKSLTDCEVYPVQCRKEDIQSFIREYYAESGDMADFLESLQESDVQVVEAEVENLALVGEKAEGARVINLVNMALLNGIKDGASDIHIEPDNDISRIRYRIDGVLQEATTLRTDMHAPVVSRVKVMARMDIAERRVPQDGRIHVRAEGREVDVRVSSMPTVLGEKIVMRLLDRGRMLLDINGIGIDDDALGVLKKALHRPNGILLVTGPTGSGKTTTLYCCLNFISSLEKNIVSIEDPVEYQLPLINQIQVHEEHGLGFARTLRSVLRQDPDIIMVGEIRDRDTAEVATQAALTGHLVLSTLHTNDSAGAIARLGEMGIEPYLQASTMIGVVAQRLLRLVCEECRSEHLPPREYLDRIGWKGTNRTFAVGRGCDHCYDTGLRGQTGIYELLMVDDALRQAILRDPSADALRAQAVRSGMRTLQDAAFHLVEQNRTSLEEALRVVYVEEHIEPAGLEPPHAEA